MLQAWESKEGVRVYEGRPVGKTPLRISSQRWDKIDPKDVGWDWLYLV
jgi:hypothetical protein